MCGFNGFYLNNICEKQDLLNQVNLMSATIEHRGPDDSGAWVEEDIGLALGHRRLSIVDISEAGHQPMHSHSSRFIIAFNGEIYNHKELRAQLELLSRDSIWRGTSDTETLLAAFERRSQRSRRSRRPPHAASSVCGTWHARRQSMQTRAARAVLSRLMGATHTSCGWHGAPGRRRR